MDVKIIMQEFQKYKNNYEIDRIFKHDGRFVVEAYPEGENSKNRVYCSYYMYDMVSKTFEPFSPGNVSLKEMDAVLESASKPIYSRVKISKKPNRSITG